MTAQSVGVRKRVLASRPKSRTGCITCKIRRVKCDELHPSCQRCTSTGRRCDGYERPRSSPVETVALNKPPSASTIGFTPGVREKRAFDFFLRQTAPTLSGPLDASFWSEFIPQLSQSIPAVWDAVVSIGSMVEHPQGDNELPIKLVENESQHVNAEQQWALGMYNRAISRALGQSQPDSSTLPIAIITSVLFLCIEFLQDNVQRSLEILLVSRRLITEFQRGNLPTSQLTTVVHNTIYPLLTRVSIMMASMLGFSFGPPILGLVPVSRYGSRGAISSLTEARSDLYALIVNTQGFIARSYPFRYMENIHLAVPTNLQAEQKDILSQLYNWHHTFSHLAQSTDSATSIAFTTSVCVIHFKIALITILTALSPLQTLLDHSMQHFEDILRHAETAINSSPHTQTGLSPDEAVKVRPSFTFDSNLVFSLYYVAVQCRHPVLRRLAVRLIRSSANKDGLCKSAAFARLAETAIEIEEEDLDSSSSSLPDESKRIQKRSHEYRMDTRSSIPKQQCFLTFTRYTRNEDHSWTPMKESRLVKTDPDLSAKDVAETPLPEFWFKHYSSLL